VASAFVMATNGSVSRKTRTAGGRRNSTAPGWKEPRSSVFQRRTRTVRERGSATAGAAWPGSTNSETIERLRAGCKLRYPPNKAFQSSIHLSASRSAGKTAIGIAPKNSGSAGGLAAGDLPGFPELRGGFPTLSSDESPVFWIKRSLAWRLPPASQPQRFLVAAMIARLPAAESFRFGFGASGATCCFLDSAHLFRCAAAIAALPALLIFRRPREGGSKRGGLASGHRQAFADLGYLGIDPFFWDPNPSIAAVRIFGRKFCRHG